MNFIEFCNYQKRTSKRKEELNTLLSIIGRVNGIATTVGFLKEIKCIIPEEYSIACPVGFPIGNDETKVKEVQSILALKAGANTLDVVANHDWISNKEYPRIRKEFETLKKIADDYGAIIRPCYDSNLFDLEKSLAVGILLNYLVDTVLIPSICYHNADYTDTIIMCAMLEKKGMTVGNKAGALSNLDKWPIPTMFCANIWREDQLSTIINSELSAMRIFSERVLSFGVYKEYMDRKFIIG